PRVRVATPHIRGPLRPAAAGAGQLDSTRRRAAPLPRPADVLSGGAPVSGPESAGRSQRFLPLDPAAEPACAARIPRGLRAFPPWRAGRPGVPARARGELQIGARYIRLPCPRRLGWLLRLYRTFGRRDSSRLNRGQRVRSSTDRLSLGRAFRETR